MEKISYFLVFNFSEISLLYNNNNYITMLLVTTEYESIQIEPSNMLFQKYAEALLIYN